MSQKPNNQFTFCHHRIVPVAQGPSSRVVIVSVCVGISRNSSQCGTFISIICYCVSGNIQHRVSLKVYPQCARRSSPATTSVGCNYIVHSPRSCRNTQIATRPSLSCNMRSDSGDMRLTSTSRKAGLLLLLLLLIPPPLQHLLCVAVEADTILL
jgi:hypothetical protein